MTLNETSIVVCCYIAPSKCLANGKFAVGVAECIRNSKTVESVDKK